MGRSLQVQINSSFAPGLPAQKCGIFTVGLVRWNTAECGAPNRRRVRSQVCMRWALSGINILADLNNGISCAYDANSFDTNHQLSRGLDGILEVTGGDL